MICFSFKVNHCRGCLEGLGQSYQVSWFVPLPCAFAPRWLGESRNLVLWIPGCCTIPVHPPSLTGFLRVGCYDDGSVLESTGFVGLLTPSFYEEALVVTSPELDEGVVFPDECYFFSEGRRLLWIWNRIDEHIIRKLCREDHTKSYVLSYISRIFGRVSYESNFRNTHFTHITLHHVQVVKQVINRFNGRLVVEGRGYNGVTRFTFIKRCYRNSVLLVCI